VSSFGHVHRSDRKADQLSLAQRYHQDADQVHDALHADVLNVLRVAGRPQATEARSALEADADTFQADIDKAAGVPIPETLSGGLADLRPKQLRYLASARRIGLLSVIDPVRANAALEDFNQDFLDLQVSQARFTNQLAAAEAATRATAVRVEQGAERRILATTAIALLGLLIQAGLLEHAASRLAAQLARERRIAETLQVSLLPDALPEVPWARLAARFLPCEDGVQVGGDWYDVVPIPSGGCYLVMGDVVGHDLAAAALMGQLRASVRGWTSENLAPAEVFDRLNRQLLAFDRNESASCVLLRLDAETCSFANAGHLPPLLVSPDGAATYLEGLSCPPLGATSEITYQQFGARLAPGSTLLLFTDGLVERRGVDLDEGLQRVRAAAGAFVAKSAGATDPDELCGHLLRVMFRQEQARDDVAMLAVTLAGVPSPRLSSPMKRRLPG
jgi:serine phosphatase RsbU (regulator of sigma subunit)